VVSQELIAAASHLADTLAEENAALTALDLPRAAALLADKQRAVTGFLAASNAPIAAQQDASFEAMVRRLQSLSDDNRALLERAIAAQGRVIGVIARAVAPVVAPSGYSSDGSTGHDSIGHTARPTAFAVCLGA
jgi:CHASE3 domain sensor protein